MKTRHSHESVLNLCCGELVEVRSKDEILATLDANGRRDALPFMPEMLQYCGRRFRVYKQAHKTCDTVRKPAALRMNGAVHLESIRCDGSAHGGCQANCLIFWKEVWLKRVLGPETSHDTSVTAPTLAWQSGPAGCTEEDLFQATHAQASNRLFDDEVFSCQATELPNATSHLPWWDIRQYVWDVRSGNIGLGELAHGASVAAFNMCVRSIRRGILGVRLLVRRSVADVNASARCNTPMANADARNSDSNTVASRIKQVLENLLVEYPAIQGKLRKTPSILLNLQPGELVQVKSKAEILATLDVNNRNRGLAFDVEMVPYCGRTYRVLRRVEKILNEKTGRMITLPNPCIILEGVVCRACSSRNRMFCPRSIYSYWHEIWLRRPQ